MSTKEWLVISGLLVIFLLAGYAAWLWHKVWRHRQQQEQLAHERNARLRGDLYILAHSLLDGQIPLIEGAIRIKVLLDNYTGPRPANLSTEIFETIYDATAHIPTHQAWKDLPSAQRQQHEQLMEQLEQQHREVLLSAAQALSTSLQTANYTAE